MWPSDGSVLHRQDDEDDNDEEEESSEEELPPREMPNRASRGRRMGQAMEDEEADAEFWGVWHFPHFFAVFWGNFLQLSDFAFFALQQVWYVSVR